MSFQDEIKKLRELAIINEDVNKILERMTGKELVSYEGIDVLVKELMTFYNSELKKKALLSHTHDDRYYTESEVNSKFTEVDNKLNEKVNKTDQYRIKPKIIGNTSTNTDLNNITDLGFYVSVSSTNKITNKPTNDNAFELTVTGIGVDSHHGCRTQLIKTIDSTCDYYVRTQTNWREPATWTEWKKIALSKELDSKLENYCPYKIGDVYITTNSSNPSSVYLGTTWQKIEGRFLLGSGSSYGLGSTGGNANISLGINNMPSHRHKVDSASASISPHTHTFEIRMDADEGGGGPYYGTPGNGHNGTVKTSNPTSSAGGGSTGSFSPYTDYQGNGSAFSIMPPYLAVNIWKRTR